jgi:predicted DsbA family dithiol-disulfide isomerase
MRACLEAAMTEMSQKRVTVDVVSDVVCPWCYIGKRRLEAALATRPDVVVDVRWRPFQLDGTIPQGGIPRQTYLANKFGGPDKITEIYSRIAGVGREVGIAFDFAAITRSPNTLDAHRLIRWAAEPGLQGAVVEALFRAYFLDGRDIGDHAVLADVAAQAGLDAGIAARLASDSDKDAVAEEIRMASELGVQGVPFFIFEGRYGVSGAQSAEVLEEIIDQVTARAVSI